jgi:hypothetical protein
LSNRMPVRSLELGERFLEFAERDAMNEKEAKKAARTWAQWVVFWFTPPDPYSLGLEEEFRREANAVQISLDVGTTSLDFAVETARELFKEEVSWLDRFDRRGVTVLTVSLTLLTAIIAGFGTKAIDVLPAIPMVALVLCAVVESLLSLGTIISSDRSPLTLVLENSKKPKEAELEYVRNIHVVVKTMQIGIGWKSMHFQWAITFLALSAVASLIPIASRAFGITSASAAGKATPVVAAAAAESSERLFLDGSAGLAESGHRSPSVGSDSKRACASEPAIA